MTDYRKFVTEDVRRILLDELSRQPSYRLNDDLMLRVLESFGHVKSRDYLRAELDWLSRARAVTLTEVGGILIAELTEAGLDHVERRKLIAGVAKPKPVI
ncbi:MAG: hypothetical protein ACK4MF_08045 [Hyphomicrobiaceae bacterium]